jgi:hypothetical protein
MGKFIRGGIIVALIIVAIGAIGVYRNSSTLSGAVVPEPLVPRERVLRIETRGPLVDPSASANLRPLPTPASVRYKVLSAVRQDLQEGSRRAGVYPFDAFVIDDDGTTLHVRVTDYWFGIPRHLQRELAWLVRQLCMKHLKQKTGEEHSVVVIFHDRTGHVVARSGSFGTSVYE